MMFYTVACISGIIVGGSALLSAVYGYTLGGNSMWLGVIFFFVFGALSALTAVLAWFQTRLGLMLVRRYTTPALVVFLLMLPITLCFVVYDTATNFGTGSLFRESEMKIADNQNTKARNERAEVSRIEKAIADIRAKTAWRGVYTAESGTEYPLTDPTAFDSQIALQEKLVAQEAARVRCGKKCEARQIKLKELQAARANAAVRADLMNQMRTYEIELKEAKSRVADTPTTASAALTHARNLGAIITGQMDPSATVKFWANYGITFAAAFACTIASIVTSVILAVMGESRQQRPIQARAYEPEPVALAAPAYAEPASLSETTYNISVEGSTPSVDRLMELARRLEAKRGAA